jgi:hypothetical protein
MATWIWVVIVAVVVVAVVAMIWAAMSKRRTNRLQDRFGPEYDRTTDAAGSRRQAEAELDARAERREHLDIRPLPAGDQRRYAARWQDVQGEFVDSPTDALAHADALVNDVMSDRGYPMDDFEQRASDISVDHPEVVENYREAHRVYAAIEHGDVSTENERQAMQHYRRLFDDLLAGDGTPVGSGTARSASAGTRNGR